MIIQKTEREEIKMIRKIKTLSGLFLILLIAFIKVFSNVAVNADEIIEEPIVIVSSYKVSNDIVVPGEKFDLILELENKDKNDATTGLLVNINFPEGITTVYPSLTQVYIDSLNPGEKRKVTFNLNASHYYQRPTIAFGVTISSETRSNYVNVFLPVELNTSPFKILSKTVPEEVGAGEKIAVSLSFKSLLDEKLSDVILSVFVDDEKKPVTTAGIGNLFAGASKTQDVTFFIYEVGKHTVRYELSYATSEGDTSTDEIFSGDIQILETPADNVSQTSEVIDESMTNQDKMIIIGCLGMSFLLAIGIVLIVKKYN